MIGVNRNHVPLDSEHHGEEGARKYPAIATRSDVDDGISPAAQTPGIPRTSRPKKATAWPRPSKRILSQPANLTAASLGDSRSGEPRADRYAA